MLEGKRGVLRNIDEIIEIKIMHKVVQELQLQFLDVRHSLFKIFWVVYNLIFFGRIFSERQNGDR